nr:VTT domain-containing protein [Candidatus Sigynarchaeota archaeon]
MDLKKILKDKKTWFILAFLAIAAATVVLLIMWLRDHTILARIAIEWLVIPVATIGAWGILLYFGVMTVQSLLIPIPSELILLLTGILWGIPGGTALGIAGSIFTGAMAYSITLRGGRPIVDKLIPKKILDPLDTLIKKYGTWFIFSMRALPLMAFDPISYASGFLKINFKKYMIATVVGSVPRSIFYALLGYWMISNVSVPPVTVVEWQTFMTTAEFDAFANMFNIVLVIIVVLLLALFLVYNFILSPYLLKKGKTAETKDAKEPTDNKKGDEPATTE